MHVGLLVLSAIILAVGGAEVVCPHGSWAVVETLPPDLKLEPVGPSTYAAFMGALKTVNSSVNIAALEVALTPPEYAAGYPDAWHGAELNATLLQAVHRGVRVGVITNDCTLPNHIFPCGPVLAWKEQGVDATLADWPHLVGSWGVQHAKIFTVDGAAGYSGSANLAWSSFSQTKEAGIMFSDCPAVVNIYDRLVGMWEMAGAANAIPSEWPSDLRPLYSAASPLRVVMGGQNQGKEPETLTIAPCYSPPQFKVGGDDCGHTLPIVIDSAVKTVQITLMDYSPASLYDKYGVPPTYWNDLDAALRRAAFRGVQVEVLVSKWEMTFPLEVPYWASLNALANVTVREFVMPATPNYREGGRVDHCKYMVVDGTIAQMMTSNWSPDYYLYFGGIGLTIRGGTVAQTLQATFVRDWESQYAHGVSV